MFNLFEPPAGLLAPEQEEALRQQMRMQGLLGLASGFFQAGTPSRTPQNLGGSAIQGLMAGQQMASDTYTQALRTEALRQQMEEKKKEALQKEQANALVNRALYGLSPTEALGITGRGPTREAAATIGSGGIMAGDMDQATILRLAANPALPKDLSDRLFKFAEQTKPRSVDLDPASSLYAQSKYGTADVTKLNRTQAADVLGFAQKPSVEQQIALARLQFETGINLQPQQPALPGVPTAPAAPTAPTQTAPQAPVPVSSIPMPSTPGLSPKAAQELRLKLAEARPKALDSAAYTISQIRDTRDTAQKLLNDPEALDSLSGAGGIAGAYTPYTKAFDAFPLLKNLQSRNFVSEIQLMRQNNPNGAGVGNVAIAEMEGLANIPASLRLGASKEFLKDQLEQLVKRSDAAINSITSSFERDYGETPQLRTAKEERIVQTAPPSAVSYLKANIRSNPNLADEFDKKYGKGAAARVLGR